MTCVLEYRRELGSDSSIKSSANKQLTPPTPITHSLEVDNNDYRFEQARLRSYQNWPVPHIIEPKKLVAAGFYYTGEGDKVKCFECHKEIHQWVEGDNAMIQHQLWSPACRYIRKINRGIVPIGVDLITVLRQRPTSTEKCGLYGVVHRPTSGPDNHNLKSELPSTGKLGCLGLPRAKHPEYVSYDARLQSFKTWSQIMTLTKEELAAAGFYYTGNNDQTRCFHCGVGLQNWKLEDDPWEQHAKWFSKCYYLLMVKGQEYVNTVTGQHISPPTEEEIMEMNLPSCIEKVQPVSTSIEMKEHEESNPGTSSQSGFMDIESNANTQNNKPMDNARMCKICCNGEIGILFQPCSHLVACVKCANCMTTCPVCREPVTKNVPVFFS